MLFIYYHELQKCKGIVNSGTTVVYRVIYVDPFNRDYIGYKYLSL